jgi:acyl-coenzyme A synthetase/AMP-(fatty) acid ligase
MEVAEAAVIAAPDAAGAIVKALVRLAAGVVPSGHSGRGSGST